MTTATQFKARLRQQGKTIRQWAKEHNFPTSAVYRVIGGVDKASFGRAHDISIAMGLKSQSQKARRQIPATPTPQPQPQQQVTAFDLAARLTPENIAVMRTAADRASGDEAERLVVLLACAEELLAGDLSADDLRFIACFIHMCTALRPAQAYEALRAAGLKVNPESPTA